MAKNNAHIGESPEQRLKRFQSGPPNEAILTLLNSIDNYFNNEIRATIKDLDFPQTSLLFLGIHAAILTISEAFFDDKTQRGYKLFLESFVDGEADPERFSLIAGDIHLWRNIVAHQWLSNKGHSFGYAYSIQEGWKREDGILYINPKIYCEHYLKAFSLGGKIWEYRSLFSDDELEAIKGRIIEKFVRN
ncbi:MAG: hypothetical protein ACREGG_04605 [Candidatus Saccharimonadales bacterium]